MTAYDERLGPPVLWRLLFEFVFSGYLTTYICFTIFYKYFSL